MTSLSNIVSMIDVYILISNFKFFEELLNYSAIEERGREREKKYYVKSDMIKSAHKTMICPIHLGLNGF